MTTEQALEVLVALVPDEVKMECYQSMGIGQASSWRILYHFAQEYPETFAEKMVETIKHFQGVQLQGES